ncbi:MAG: cob(I)yrinic acid a,c-diamide adenosyltransferase [Coraliomargarita sp.]
MSISTQTGDDGTTSLLFRKRVAKTHPRVMTYGRVDELGSSLGLCRAFCHDATTKDHLLEIQKDLIHHMSELATLDEDQERWMAKFSADAITETKIQRLTELVKTKEATIKFKGWTQSGETPADAFFDQARTTCRRAERGVVALRDSGASVRPELIQYLNRLSDLLWLWGRQHA